MNLWADDNASMMEAFMAATDLLHGFPWATRPRPSGMASSLDPGRAILGPPTPSPPPSAFFNQETLQQRLQALIEGARESWTYGIFWQSSVDAATGTSFLGWASLLGDAVSYVNELRSKLQDLEANKEDLQAQIQGLRKERESAPAQRPESDLKMTNGGGRCHGVEIEVKLLGSEAMIRLQSQKRNHPAAVLMAARSGSALRERVGGEGPHDPAGDGEDVEPGVHAGAAQLCCLR
ncbi:hypothetical protein OPV22_001810 [Ensete ventricosum]|uniref:Transcription factor n=1 Tax=Ensete ventricosum TaxID=4639 RepID=A0AAV8RSX3_ENSVE|nr:hypothetical protein OPV22_001810 [Ensete ventricosum]